MTGDRDRHRTGPSSHGPHPLVLTTRALVLGRDGTLLLTLSLLAPAVTVIRVPIVRTHGSVSPVTDDAVAGAAGAASAGQAHGIEPARIWALVWEDEARRSQTAPGAMSAPTLGRTGDPWAYGLVSGHQGGGQESVGTGRAEGDTEWQGWALPQEPPTLRLALARAHFLEEKATGSSRAAHYAVVVIGDPVIPAHGCLQRRTALWPQEHLRAPRPWVNAADTAGVIAGALAGV